MKNKKLVTMVWGILLIVVGVLVALKAFHILTFDLFFDGWWTLLIIIPSAIGLFTDKDKTGTVIGLLVGVGLLLACQNVFDFGFLLKLAIPVAIVFCGWKLLRKSFRKEQKNDEEYVQGYETSEEKNENGKERPSGFALFSGTDMRPVNEVFNGAELTAIFGGVTCDLRQAIFVSSCTIDATAVFGGIDILLPQNVNVKIDSTSIFGGVSAKNKQNRDENTITIYVKGVSMFGGVEIK